MKFLNLQVSNGLEILLSMGNRLTLNIRSESAYGIGEVLKRFTKRPSGRVSFSFTRGYSGARKSCRRPQTPACIPTRSAPIAYAPSLLSTPVCEPGIRPLAYALEGERHLLSSLCQPSVRFTQFFPAGSDGRASHPNVAFESGFKPMTEGLWLIHVTEPVTETIS